MREVIKEVKEQEERERKEILRKEKERLKQMI